MVSTDYAPRLEAAQARKFHHPYEPYEIQTQFMSALYDCIEQGKGKSLSLICGSLTWLRDHKRIKFEEGLSVDAVDDDEPDWMIEHAREEKRRAALHQRQQLEERIARVRAKERKLKARHTSGEPHRKRQKISSAEADAKDDDEARFVLDDYESEEEQAQKAKSKGGSDLGFSAETLALMKKLGMPVERKREDEETEEPDELKIFYCSRTHSQLQQFASELRRVKMPPAISAELPYKSTPSCDVSTELEEDFKHLTLGSRKNLCINPKVAKLGSTAMINEKCLDLQKTGTAQDHKCPFLPNKESESLVHDFRDHVLAEIRDIEDLGAVGKQLGICPYYASRAAVKPSEIVTLPYPLLLQKSAREALDINMKDHIIIIDEAHNLMDSIIGIYSVSVSLAQLQKSRAQLTTYLQKFRNRLKGRNRVYVAQTVRLMDSLIGYLQGTAAQSRDPEGVVKVGDLMAGKGVDQINLYKLLRYLQESKLARKVDGYIVHTEEQANNQRSGGAKPQQQKTPGSHMPVLTHIQSFFAALLNPSAEGRFFFSKNDDNLGICLKYMLLDPTHHFREIVEDARAVILAGGTMSPMSDYENHLFSYLTPSRITTLSCGHVIPPSNLLAWPVTRGPSGTAFEFTFEKRNAPALLADLGLAILEFIKAIPDGVVVFFPSYAYLDQCVAAWKRTAAAPAAAAKGSTSASESLFDALQSAKPVFHEARSQQSQANDQPHRVKVSQPPLSQTSSSSTESVLSAYTHAVSTGGGRGALLLAVVGGSLSEGINFSDTLGRGVAVVGLPFPNPHSAEWRAKMAYVSKKAAESDGGNAAGGKAAAREFYENACMRAVNQCVGRAIRHQGDYAAILLLDGRYDGERIRKKLPGWIRGSLREGRGAGEVVRGVKQFFEGKK